MKQIVLVVGASGVGKDTLLKEAQNKMSFNFVKRYITREPDKNEQNYYVEENAFEVLKNSDFFISSWEAHNNKYGISKNQIKDGLNIISISRGAIKDFETNFQNVITIEVTLPKDVLYERLKNRARESEEGIINRLNRVYEKIVAKNLIYFDNSQNLKTSTKKFVEILNEIKNK